VEVLGRRRGEGGGGVSGQFEEGLTFFVFLIKEKQ